MIEGSSTGTPDDDDKTIVSSGIDLSDVRPPFGGGFFGIFFLSLDEGDL